MQLEIKPSDLRYKYQRRKDTRSEKKFTGKPDPTSFDRDNLYEVIPMLAAVMETLGSCDSLVLQQLEEVMIHDMPRCIATREEVFDCLVAVMTDVLKSSA